MSDFPWKPLGWMVVVICYGLYAAHDAPFWIVAPVGLLIGWQTQAHVRWEP